MSYRPREAKFKLARVCVTSATDSKKTSSVKVDDVIGTQMKVMSNSMAEFTEHY